MATLEYISVPPCAIRLRSADRRSVQPEPESKIALPTETGALSSAPISPASPTATATSPTKYTVLPQILLSTAMVSSGASLPTSPTSGSPPARLQPVTLLSKKDPLSIPITTVNFRRFVARVGPVFWLQDRVEEIVMWKRGWKVTSTWMAAYAFLCIFPRLIFLVPHAVIVSVMLANSPTPAPPKSISHPPAHFLLTPMSPTKTAKQEEPKSTPVVSPVPEGSKEWLANIQGIQNLMGLGADVHDALAPICSQLSLLPQPPSLQPTPASLYIFLLTVLSLPLALFLVISPYFPLRLVALIGGLLPVLLLHPKILPYVPLLGRASVEVLVWTMEASRVAYARLQPWVAPKLNYIGGYFPFSSHLATLLPVPSTPPLVDQPLRHLRVSIGRLIDDDRLRDEVWAAELKEVEIYENERWKADESASSLGLNNGAIFDGGSSEDEVGRWSKKHLKETERSGWTRGRDGWSGVGDDGYVSNLTFSLASGWAFVDTEDWRQDVIGEWANGLVDDDGWTYTNDVWSEPRPYPMYKSSTAAHETVTRRRRWTRRIWYHGESKR